MLKQLIVWSPTPTTDDNRSRKSREYQHCCILFDCGVSCSECARDVIERYFYHTHTFVSRKVKVRAPVHMPVGLKISANTIKRIKELLRLREVVV